MNVLHDHTVIYFVGLSAKVNRAMEKKEKGKIHTNLVGEGNTLPLRKSENEDIGK